MLYGHSIFHRISGACHEPHNILERDFLLKEKKKVFFFAFATIRLLDVLIYIKAETENCCAGKSAK